jgi:ankyrin repeat protein
MRLTNRSNTMVKASKYLPLHYTAACGEIKLSEYLLDHGAYVDAMDADGNTALMWAVRKGHAELAYILIEKHGANVNAINFDGETPLMLAVLVMNRDLVNYLLLHGANPNAT